MTFGDYLAGHPCWTLVYLIVICFTAIAVAQVIGGTRR